LGDRRDRLEDRVRGPDATSLGCGSRAWHWPAARPDDGRTRAIQAARTRERRGSRLWL